MDNPDSVVPMDGFCENCGHFLGRHQELRCHMPPTDEHPNGCPCPGARWKEQMYEMDMDAGAAVFKIPSYFEHLKGFYLPVPGGTRQRIEVAKPASLIVEVPAS